MDITVQGAEDQVAAGENILQMLRQSGGFPGCLGVPRAEKGGDCPGGGGVYTRQQLFVQRSAGFKALPRPWGLPLLSIPSR